MLSIWIPEFSAEQKNIENQESDLEDGADLIARTVERQLFDSYDVGASKVLSHQ